MMTAPNVLAVSNWITELKLLMLVIHEYKVEAANPNIALVTAKQTRVLVPWSVVETSFEARAKFLVECCVESGVDVISLQQEINKHLPSTTQSGG